VEAVHQLFAYDGLKIIQRDDMIRYSIDSLLLSDFVRIPKRVRTIADFGCGNAPVLLYLSLKTNKPMIGFDLLPEAVDLARRSVALNGLSDQIEIVEADIRTLHEQYPASAFDLIVANPPFFKVHEQSPLNELEPLRIARHELTLDLDTLVRQAKRLLSTGGLFCFVHRVDRLEDIFRVLQERKMAIKRLRFVYPKQNENAAMVLIEARNNGSSTGLKLEPPFVVLDEHGNETKQMKAIHFFGKKESHEARP
jgi:tRNA1Val (adenine37-N6)-methyltransferase